MAHYLLIPLSYLLGAVPFGLLLGLWAGKDVRREGSGNIGATNVLRTCGAGWGIAALVLDLLKGLVPALLAGWLAPAGPIWPVLAGLAAVLGHCYPIYLRFAGGKGVATTAGVLLAIMPLPLLVALGVFVLVVALTRYVSLGSMTAAAALLIARLLLAEAPWSRAELPATLFAAAALILVLARHRDNIRRLLAGTESRFGRKKPTS